MFSPDEGADVSINEATNISKHYKLGRANHFNGKIHQVCIEIPPAKPASASTELKESKAAQQIEAAKE